MNNTIKEPRIEKSLDHPVLVKFAQIAQKIDGKIYREAGISLPVIQEAVRSSHHGGDDAVRQMVEQRPPFQGPACKAGCDLCCTLEVLVSLPEALHLITLIKARPDAAEIKAKVAEVTAQIKGLDRDQRWRQKIYCPLLKEHMCSVCQDRPLSCRAWNSLDYAACKANSKSVPVEGGQYFTYTGICVGQQFAFQAAARQNLWVPVELVHALDVGLNGEGNAVADLLIKGVNRFAKE